MFRPQLSDSMLQRKNGNTEDEKIIADSTGGKNKKVWAPVVALDQAEFQSENNSRFSSVSRSHQSDKLESEWEYKILVGMLPATWQEGSGSRAAWTEKDFFVTVPTIFRWEGSKLTRMRVASVDVD